MKIEEAKEILNRIDIKNFLSGSIEQSNYIVDKADEVNLAIECLLKELKKKDKVIDMIVNTIVGDRKILTLVCKHIINKTDIECEEQNKLCDDCIKEYFYKKAEEN